MAAFKGDGSPGSTGHSITCVRQINIEAAKAQFFSRLFKASKAFVISYRSQVLLLFRKPMAAEPSLILPLQTQIASSTYQERRL
tara:strand:+ start:491 stop:742 length:252 start_codon:yes stop_codon:yes gene_type:complete